MRFVGVVWVRVGRGEVCGKYLKKFNGVWFIFETSSLRFKRIRLKTKKHELLPYFGQKQNN